jgi:hypothetical protein
VNGYDGSAALLAQLVEHLHGKEGVDGSSPSEGFAKVRANSASLSLSCKRLSRAGKRVIFSIFAWGFADHWRIWLDQADLNGV